MTYSVACTIDRDYAPHFVTMCCSLFENNRDSFFEIYLIFDELAEGDTIKIEKLFEKYEQSIRLIKVDKRQFQGFPISAHATLANYFRISLPDILPQELDNVLYLDCDLIINGSILEIWDYQNDDVALHAWGYPNSERKIALNLDGDYFNSGVMLINLKFWRQNKVGSKVVKYIEENRDLIEFWDQDAFNAVLKNDWQPLGQEYNYTKGEDFKKEGIQPHIIHFVGMHKPWNPHCKHELKWMYYVYYDRTPYAQNTKGLLVKKLNNYSKRIQSKFNHFIRVHGEEKKVSIKNKYSREILMANAGNNWIGERLKNGDSFFVGRIGSTELSCLCYYLKIYEYDIDVYHKMKKNMKVASGFFPTTDYLLNMFTHTYVNSALRLVDMIGVWYNKGENEIVNRFSNAKLCELRGLEPYYHSAPWSKYLKDKKVLVIHPFSESIKKQYKFKDKLFPKGKCLPNFELKTITAIQTIAGNDKGYESWFNALDKMKSQISKIDFDIAIIGAGAYGFHLGGYVKSLGKSAIHLGGATQVLFGIQGKRWENNKEISSFFNEYWTYPTDAEKPAGALMVENGCYW
ncbi:MAG: glycosyltransferase family 8 protein [Bacteroidota bacterium]